MKKQYGDLEDEYGDLEDKYGDLEDEYEDLKKNGVLIDQNTGLRLQCQNTCTN